MSNSKFAKVNDIVLHYSNIGSPDKTALAFINPLGSDYRIWDVVVQELADDYAIILHDKRGHGLSECPPGPYTIRDHSTDMAGLLEYLEVNEVVIIAVSIGGLIALDYTKNYPHKVKALVMGGTAAKIGTAEYWQERVQAIEKDGIESMATTILSKWFAPDYQDKHPAEYEGYENMLSRTPIEGYLASCAALGSADLRDELHKIDAQTLVVCGEEDSATPPELVREFSESLMNSHFEIINECGHNPPIEQPDKMAQLIRAFLQEALSD